MYDKAYYQRNKDKYILQSRKWRKLNPKKVKDVLERSRKNFPERKLFNNAKARAKKSGLEFTILITDIKIPNICPLLGTKLDAWGPLDGCPSLDRIDNGRGYTPDNIWVISTQANRMKNTASKSELITFAKSILNEFHEDILDD